jgi:RHS repeat-associated protein
LDFVYARGVYSSSGSVDEIAIYSVYGKQTISTGSKVTPFGFQGSYTDSTALLYLINRYYDPATGQFVSVDPMVNETNQPYAYAGDDPVNGVDPSGLLPFGLSDEGSLSIDEILQNPQ